MSRLKLSAGGKKMLWMVLIMLFAGSGGSKPLTTELFLRGYSIIPTPQKVLLESGDLEFGDSWAYNAQVPEGHAAVRSLLKDLRDFHSVDLKQATTESKKLIVLSVTGDTVKTAAGPEIDRQAYRLKIAPARPLLHDCSRRKHRAGKMAAAAGSDGRAICQGE